MNIPYLDIAKAVALRANQLVGGAVSARVSAYGAASISAFNSVLDGVDVPYQALRQDILDHEAAIASMMANSTNPVWRNRFFAFSSPIPSGDPVPTTSAGGDAWIGALDGFFDADTNTPLTEGDLHEILRYNSNPGSFWIVPKYLFKIVGSNLFHTRTALGALASGCVWSRTSQEAQYDANGESTLPLEMAPLWIARVLSNLPQEDWFVAEGGLYTQLAGKYEQELFEGKVAKMTLPILPTTNARVDPAHD